MTTDNDIGWAYWERTAQFGNSGSAREAQAVLSLRDRVRSIEANLVTINEYLETDLDKWRDAVENAIIKGEPDWIQNYHEDDDE